MNSLPAYAALLNAASGHAYDLDNWEEPGNTHPTIVIFPALLAVAETVPLTGAQMFAAYCLGIKVICRLGEAVTPDHFTRPSTPPPPSVPSALPLPGPTPWN